MMEYKSVKTVNAIFKQPAFLRNPIAWIRYKIELRAIRKVLKSCDKSIELKFIGRYKTHVFNWWKWN